MKVVAFVKANLAFVVSLAVLAAVAVALAYPVGRRTGDWTLLWQIIGTAAVVFIFFVWDLRRRGLHTVILLVLAAASAPMAVAATPLPG